MTDEDCDEVMAKLLAMSEYLIKTSERINQMIVDVNKIKKKRTTANWIPPIQETK